MFGLFKRIKRRHLLKRPFPPGWLSVIERYHGFYGRLSPDLQEKFRNMLVVFASEKHFIGAKGFVITDEVRVVISGAAVRLILFLDMDFYDRLTEIVVYPHHYKHRDETGVVLGEAHQWGTVVLSWPAVLEGLANPCDGHDTALHEFAHVLDRASGQFDGTPNLRASEHYRPWARVMTDHYLKLKAAHPRQRLVLRGYGAKNEAEFFAVATESFFERPDQMKQLTPDLYDELRRLYGFDPVADPSCGIMRRDSPGN
jgi:MtfA peptidase